MAFLVQGDSSTAVNPVLDLFTSFDNVLTDIYSLAFQIFDITTDANRNEFFQGNPNNVQVFPSPPGTKFVLDVNNLVSGIPPGHKISTGHYYAPWTAPTDANLGNYVIAWYYKRTASSPEKVYQEEFVVVDNTLVTTGSSINAKLQLYMQDVFAKNQLLDALEYTPQQYDLAIEMTVMRFNTIPVLTDYQAPNFPSQAKYLLFLGGAAHLLRSTSIEQLRNQLTYTDGNIHVGITDKHALYIQAGNIHMQEFDQFTRMVKNNLNNDAAWEDADSPYIAPLGGWGNSGFGWGWG